jgi:hypothetical protein
MTTYRKKPVEIDAEQWDGTAVDAGRIIDWLLTDHPDSLTPSFYETNETEHKHHNELSIPTLEGRMMASPGDFIIVGVKGEIYPCKPDIFEATYEPVELSPKQLAKVTVFGLHQPEDAS